MSCVNITGVCLMCTIYHVVCLSVFCLSGLCLYLCLCVSLHLCVFVTGPVKIDHVSAN